MTTRTGKKPDSTTKSEGLSAARRLRKLFMDRAYNRRRRDKVITDWYGRKFMGHDLKLGVIVLELMGYTPNNHELTFRLTSDRRSTVTRMSTDEFWRRLRKNELKEA